MSEASAQPINPKQEIVIPPTGRNRFFAFTAYFLAPLVPYLLWGVQGLHPIPLWAKAAFFGLSVFGLVMVTLETFVARVVANEEGITIYNQLNRRKIHASYAEITRYLPNKNGRWGVLIGEAWYCMPDVEIPEVHRLLRAMAPRALAAKRWKCGQVPPPEEFRNICPYDILKCRAEFVSALIYTAPFIIVSSWTLSLLYFLARMLPAIYELRFLFVRLEVTDRGIAVRGAVAPRSIEWGDITAIFCHQEGKARSFVVVSRQTTITIPRPVAIDLDIMRKLFYSLPDGTPCVNFDDNFRKGYRRRQKKKLGITVGATELAGGSF